MTRRIALAGWFGTDNLGDELILRALAEALRARDAEPLVVSVDPARTDRMHDVESVAHGSLRQSRALARTLRAADGMAVAGGLIQSETSPWNIPFHTSRLRAAAAARCPAAAVGMGVGRVRGPVGRSLSHRSLQRLRRVVVRDDDSAQRLRRWGLRHVVVGADPVMAIEPATVEPADTICVILRTANRRGLRTAAAKAARAELGAVPLDRIARSIDAAAATTGLTVRLVAFQASRDDAILRQLADRLSVTTEVVTPSLDSVLGEVGRSRLVVTMRYHGAIAALLHDRPAVLINYSPKMAALADEAGGWAPLVELEQLESGQIEVAVSSALDHPGRVSDARAALRGRLGANDAVLDELAGLGG